MADIYTWYESIEYMSGYAWDFGPSYTFWPGGSRQLDTRQRGLDAVIYLEDAVYQNRRWGGGGPQRRHGDHVLNRWEGRRLCYIIDGSDNIRRPLQLLLNNAHNPPGQPNTHAHSLALQLANLELRLTYKKSL